MTLTFRSQKYVQNHAVSKNSVRPERVYRSRKVAK